MDLFPLIFLYLINCSRQIYCLFNPLTTKFIVRRLAGLSLCLELQPDKRVYGVMNKNTKFGLIALAAFTALTLSGPAFADGIDMGAGGATANLGGDTGSHSTSVLNDGSSNGANQGSSFGFDESSPATASQGKEGDVGRTTDFTRGKYYGNSQTTGAQYQTSKGDEVVKEYNDINLLSNYSFDNSAVPSGSFNYGFNGSGDVSQMGAKYVGNGWYLPKTSTGSVDLNIVSP